jgi:hypothetical protein
MFNKMIEWFTRPQITEIEYYICSHNPKNTADVEQLINEFNYKRKLQCF